MSSLDELLRYDDTPAAPPRSPVTRWRWRIRAVAGSVLATVAIWLLLRVALRIDVPFVLLLLLVFTSVALHRLLSSLRTAPPVPTEVPSHDGTREDWEAPDGVYTASRRWSDRLGASSRDAARYTAIVAPPLRELVEERLRLRHGVGVRTEPERARNLMGEPLWTFLYQEVRQTPSPRELASMVARVESL